MGRGYIPWGEKRLSSANPSLSSTTFGSREMKRRAQNHSLGWSGPNILICHPAQLQPSVLLFRISSVRPRPVSKPQARTSLALVYERVSRQLNAAFSQLSAASECNTDELQQQHFTARQDNLSLCPEFPEKKKKKFSITFRSPQEKRHYSVQELRMIVCPSLF